MADDRPVEDTVDQVGRLQQELDDFRSTIIARLSRRATGDVEPTIRTVAKADTLILNGQQVSRTDYAALWAWAQEQGLVITGLFTNGNGSTTFGLPDFRGRVPIGVGTLGSDSYALGALTGSSTRVLALANMPAHDHDVSGSGSTGSSGSHGHSGSANSAGSHGGHNSGTYNASNGAGSAFSVADNSQNSGGSHSHSVDINDAGSHTHSVTLNINEVSRGSGTAFDIRQPSIAINWLVWT